MTAFFRARALMLAGTALGLLGAQLLSASCAAAQTATPANAHTQGFDIPAQPLREALHQLMRQGSLQIAFEASDVDGRSSSPVAGSMGVSEALSRLLAGTGLTFRYLTPGSVVLEHAPQAANGTIQLGSVRVVGEAAAPAPLGTDGAGLTLTMTEGTKSLAGRYAQAGGKSAELLREIPRSVSVLTAQEIEDKNIVTVTQALDQVTGINVASYNTRTPVFYSRGFLVSNLTIDGGSPMRMHDGLQSIVNGVGLPNLLAYDHVEVLRGADGLYSGNGEASATINLVRKRPTDHFQLKGAAYAGSWNNYRGELDISGPITKSGNLRARAVMGIQDSKSYFSGAYTKDKFFYGIAEWDAGPHTTLSLGGSYDDLNAQKYERTLAWRAGSLGTPDNLPILSIRDSWMPSWSYDKAKTWQIFAKASHDLSKDWNLTVNGTYNRTDSNELYGYYGSGINSDAAVPSGLLMRWMSQGYAKQTMVDTNLKGKFTLLGQTHDLAVGANYSRSHANSTNPIGYVASVTLDQYLNYYRNTAPTAADISTWTGYGEWGGVYGTNGWNTTRYGFYGTLGLHLADPLRVILGGRYSRNTNFNNQTIGKFVPYYAATYDVAKDWTVFANVAEIFEVLQAKVPVGTWNADPALITWSDKPTTGMNYETGIKGDLAGGRLQAAASLFYIEKKNVYVNDDTQGQVVIPGYGTTYMQRIARKMTSKGIDLELKGAVTPAVQVSLGYTFNVTHNEEDGGAPILVWTPKHSARLWGTWTLPGALERVKLGGGVRIFGNSELRGGYAVVGASVDYRIDRHFTLGVNIENLGDRIYRTSTSSAATYGDPRNFMVTLRGQY